MPSVVHCDMNARIRGYNILYSRIKSCKNDTSKVKKMDI